MPFNPKDIQRKGTATAATPTTGANVYNAKQLEQSPDISSSCSDKGDRFEGGGINTKIILIIAAAAALFLYLKKRK